MKELNTAVFKFMLILKKSLLHIDESIHEKGVCSHDFYGENSYFDL